MEQSDDDEGHHPYEGTLPSTTPPPQYHQKTSGRYEGSLERAIRAENQAIRGLTGASNISRLNAPTRAPRHHEPWAPTKADRVSSALWAIALAGYAAAQSYAGIESLTISSTIMSYLAR